MEAGSGPPFVLVFYGQTEFFQHLLYAGGHTVVVWKQLKKLASQFFSANLCGTHPGNPESKIKGEQMRIFLLQLKDRR